MRANIADGLTASIARHVRATRWSDLNADVVGVTRRSLVDATGVMLAASGLGEACEAFAELARAGGDRGPSTVLGWGFATSPIMAAFANGAMAHALDFEDTHDATLVHPHAAVVPAALAVAEWRGGVSGRDFLTAIAIGADVTCRLALGLTESAENRGFYFLPMLGAYGAAAAAAKLLGLDEDMIEQALALASCQAVFSDALKTSESSHLRAIRDGFGAKAGVTAALLASKGVKGFARPLEGPGGVYANYAGGRYDAQRMLDGLGEVFEGARVSFKPWPSCRGTHAFIEAALQIARAPSFAADRIVAIRATVSPFFQALCNPPEQKRRPRTAIDAKFSVPFTTAVALAQGGVRLEHFSPEGRADPCVLRLADRVACGLEPAWKQAESTRGALTIELADGRQWRQEVVEPRGHPSNPMSADELKRKFLDCAAHARIPAPPQETQALFARLESVGELSDVRDLFQLPRTSQ
ncbi:MAG TPA: MmgE/PrpD family protein [Xanthobacteraceae bacterium]